MSSVDLTNCDREPIHIPGSIQPGGCLLACDAGVEFVLRHSTNSEMVGYAGDLVGRRLDDILGAALVHDIRNGLTGISDGGRPASLFAKACGDGRSVDVSIHQHKGAVIVEFEPAGGDVGQAIAISRTLISRLAATETSEKLVANAPRLIQAMLGYDRVMVYRFAEDGSGKVISEAKKGNLESFLGQHFPAGDIPQQARTLYLRNTIRVISDVDFQPVPVVPSLDASGEPLDLSFAHLRSVSPVHCEYLRNMGVSASMSISIVVNGALWGLIACHHYAPKALTMAQRVAAEMFGDFFSLHINALHNKHSLATATAARTALDTLVREVMGAQDIHDALRQVLGRFGDLIPSDGLGLWFAGRWTGHGNAPPDEAIPELTRFARSVSEGKVWATQRLSGVLPDAAGQMGSVAGVLIVPLSQRPRDYLFFFRQELVETLNWAGDPTKSYGTGPLGDRLTPRKSFEIWKETVLGQCSPWTESERGLAEATHIGLVSVVLHHSELIADERAQAEAHQKMLNDELNHRVKNILAVIKSLITRSARDGETLHSYADSLAGRIQALSAAHDQVAQGEGGGALRDLLATELSPYRTNGRSISLSGPNIWLDPRAFSILALVVHELSTNAAKYGSLSRPGGRLFVTWNVDGVGACDLHWSESDGPAVSPPSRSGFGTVLIERSVPFDLGGESDVRYHADGVVARFKIPPRFISLRQAAANILAPSARAAEERRENLIGKTVLVVEDQMLIALDLEKSLDEAGLTVLATVTNSREAIDFLARQLPDLAILDMNLGDDTSEAVADLLLEKGVPFLFSTGYTDNQSLPAAHAGVPIVRKPYAPDAILSLISRLLA